MKSEVRASQGRKAPRPINTKLLKQVTELQKLRRQVRLAEAAIKSRHEVSQARRP